MKVIFWKNAIDFYILLFFNILCFIMLIIGLVITSMEKYNWPFLVFFMIMFFGTFLALIENISKIAINEKGIEWNKYKKRITFILWDEINELKPIPHGRGAVDLLIKSNNKEVKLGLTKKMYDAIMILCPNVYVKNAINDIECFKCFHKKDKKSPE